MKPQYVTIACLANSRKMSGRCVAGKIMEGPSAGRWVRPVSDRPGEEVSEHERQYQDGTDPKVLDLIRIPFLQTKPKPYQPENRLIDGDAYWEKIGQVSPSQVKALLDQPTLLWTNDQSTMAGLNDRVELTEASKLKLGSLYLIEVPNLELRVFAPGADFGNPKRRVQGRFTLHEISYHLWVTDPGVEREYLLRPDGNHRLGRHFVTVSLGEPKDGFCYKLIAAMMSA